MMTSLKPVARSLCGMAVGVALAIGMATAGAAVLYEQLPDRVNGYPANNVEPQQLADNFTLSAPAKVASITWWGVNAGVSNSTDNFLVRIFSDASGPGTLLHSFNAGAVTRSATSSQLLGLDEYQYDFTLPTELDLSADTYYLSVHNLNDDPSIWAWESGNPGDQLLSYRSLPSTENGPWNAENGDLAFRLNGTQAVPEPGSMALLLLAGTALLLTRRQTTRHHQQQ